MSLIGHVQHAASVVKPGRTFLRHLIDLSTSVKELHHRIHVRNPAISDIQWWLVFLERWNGCSFIPPAAPSQSFVSDTSGNWGCGACWCHSWLQLQWPNCWRSVNIAIKELVPIVLAVAVWGPQWRASRVQVRCDNAAVVAAVNLGSARDRRLMQLLRCLHFFCAEFGVSVTASHIRGSPNLVADAISRNNLSLFHSLVPQAPTSLPPALGQLLLSAPVNWTLRRWRQLFCSSLAEVLLPQPPEPMAQGPRYFVTRLMLFRFLLLKKGCCCLCVLWLCRTLNIRQLNPICPLCASLRLCSIFPTH